MLKYILLFIVGIVIGIIISQIYMKRFLNKRDKELCDVLMLCIQEQFDCAKKNCNLSGVDYILQKKGTQYAIYYFGKVYEVLHRLRGKDYHISKVEQSLKAFLSTALAEDIKEYKQDQQKYKEKEKQVLEEIERYGQDRVRVKKSKEEIGKED